MQKQNKKKILLTGGHASSTIFATIEELKRRNLNVEPVFVGVKTAIEGKRAKTLAQINFENTKVKTYFIFTGRIQRKFSFWTIPSLIKIPIGFFHALLVLMKTKPQVVVAYGGSVSFQIVFWAYLFGIPIIVHEQTSVAGRANFYSSYFATKIAIARETSQKYFNPQKTIITGNPISLGVSKLKPKTEKNKKTTIFVHGGQSGSSTINKVIGLSLNKLLVSHKVIHQTGQVEYSKYLKTKSKLPLKLLSNYEVIGIIKSKDFYKYLKRADIIISRSGANFVSELLITKVPTILIPIPFSYMDEQTNNAKIAQEFGIARILPEKNLNSKKLLTEIKYLEENWKAIIKNTKNKKSPDINAAKKLVNVIENYLN
jgi:UDP-N-acetylglucosamine--N-acetylmuramyl-(pentapeptide) pyrophosphoryl-undecaprenol N-acetylglucosamine transferase